MTTPLGARWLVGLSMVAVAALTATFVAAGASTPPSLLRALALVLASLATYSWVLHTIGLSLFFSIVALLTLLWAWAARHDPVLGSIVLGFAASLAAAAVTRRRRSRRLLRLQESLEDLTEEQRVKEQLIGSAHQTHGALQRKLSRYVQLQAIAETLSNMTDVASIAQLAVDSAFNLIGKSDACLLFLVDAERQELSLFASKKRDASVNIHAKHGDQFDRYILRTHRPLLVNDVRRDFRFTVNVSQDRPISAVIACPLILGESPEGVLRLDSAQPGAYTQDDLRFLDIFLDLVATALTNARLFGQIQQLAVTDGLTGLALRRPFMEALGRELVRAGRSREPASVLIIDVDHFKRYNDTFGHTAGDVVLKGIAEMLREAAPPGALAARHGGEEFAVLLPRMSRGQATEVAEAIRALVERRRFRDADPRANGARRDKEQRAGAPPADAARVTVSAGVATFPEDAQSELELIRVADERLYRAKHDGRNLVCAAR